MIQVNLDAIPNQSFSINLNNRVYDFTLSLTNGVMSATILRDNVEIVSGQRMVANFPLIPYHYLEDGNFVFETQNDDLPDYTQFGITQYLLYFSADELGAIRAST